VKGTPISLIQPAISLSDCPKVSYGVGLSIDTVFTDQAHKCIRVILLLLVTPLLLLRCAVLLAHSECALGCVAKCRYSAR
jgi:hypothetical protein